MKKWPFVLPLMIIAVFVFFISGYRFTAFSAAKSNSFLSKDAELVERYDADSSVIFLFKSDQEEMYQTIHTEKSGLLFLSSFSTYIPFSKDKVQTVGGMSVSTEKDAATLLSVISYDEEIAYIEAGVEPDIIRKEVNKGERVSFLFPFSEQVDFLYPAAYDKEGKKLYYYGYPKGTNEFKSEDFKWHRIDEQT
ncbi:hypothetical protein D3H55_14095 [Bacillus salacetis]|uniref:Uncharacterized protein n=1 Tax=Bacillus salacetis TaxID=2315464 RepID=A0A3A1R0W7_9BACI|nr:hypothetical protein [Bacillus salacetis]RIW32007.1 hypothetical protein D3H55_14095 [Bacillus salacetis]